MHPRLFAQHNLKITSCVAKVPEMKGSQVEGTERLLRTYIGKFSERRFSSCVLCRTGQKPEHGDDQEEKPEEHSMRKNLLMSVSAVALIASAGIVTAQDKGGISGGPGGGAAQAPQSTSPAQQSAPSAQPGGGEMRGGTTGQGEPRGGAEPKGTEPKRGQTEQRMDQKGDQPQRSQEQRQHDQKGAQEQRQNQRENRAQDKSDNKGATDTRSRQDSTTTGQGAAGTSSGASLTTEQRSKISTTIKQSNVRPVTNINFNVSVGTVVPRNVTLHALPASVVEVYPQWRSYRFILVGDEIVIIEPDSYRIVAVIAA